MNIISMHSPLTAKISGLREMKVTKIMGLPMGGEYKYYLTCEMMYDDFEALQQGLREGKASGKDFMGREI